ncbi:hypothetical protein Gasu2_41450 [Galdieria sulphuraria]|nr:hypothetical protein Gasu2_41450 [Galdieria sulphuraria]
MNDDDGRCRQGEGCLCFGLTVGGTLPCYKVKKRTSWNMKLSSYKKGDVYLTKERIKGVQYRQGSWQDLWVIFSALWSEKMNIMGAFSPQYFIIAHQPKNDYQVLGFGQMKPLSKYARKLASLYVYPEYRGCGMGSAILNQLLEREKKGFVDDVAWEVYLTCLTRSESFYNKFGFMSIPIDSSIPFAMRMEYYLGSAVIKLIEPKEQVLVMRRLSITN